MPTAYLFSIIFRETFFLCQIINVTWNPSTLKYISYTQYEQWITGSKDDSFLIMSHNNLIISINSTKPASIYQLNSITIGAGYAWQHVQSSDNKTLFVASNTDLAVVNITILSSLSIVYQNNSFSSYTIVLLNGFQFIVVGTYNFYNYSLINVTNIASHQYMANYSLTTFQGNCFCGNGLGVLSFDNELMVVAANAFAVLLNVNLCPPLSGNYFDLKTNTCLKCENNCLVCYSSTNCTQCISNYYLYEAENSIYQCVQYCPAPMAPANNLTNGKTICVGCPVGTVPAVGKTFFLKKIKKQIKNLLGGNECINSSLIPGNNDSPINSSIVIVSMLILKSYQDNELIIVLNVSNQVMKGLISKNINITMPSISQFNNSNYSLIDVETFIMAINFNFDQDIPANTPVTIQVIAPIIAVLDNSTQTQQLFYLKPNTTTKYLSEIPKLTSAQILEKLQISEASPSISQAVLATVQAANYLKLLCGGASNFNSVLFLQIAQFMRFLNISYPQNLLTLFHNIPLSTAGIESKISNTFFQPGGQTTIMNQSVAYNSSLLRNLQSTNNLQTFINPNEQQVTAENFQIYGIYPFFLDNYGIQAIGLGIFLFLALLSTLIWFISVKRLTKDHKFSMIFEKAMYVFRWKLCIQYFLQNFMLLTLSICLNFLYVNSNETSYQKLNYALGIIFCVLFLLPAWMIFKVYQRAKILKMTPNAPVQEEYAILYLELKEGKAQYFYPVVILRSLIVGTFVSFLYAYPLALLIIFLLMQFVIIGIFVYVQPFASKQSKLKEYGNEGFLTLIFLFVLILYFEQSMDYNTKSVIGTLLVILIFFQMGWNLLFSIKEIIVALKQLCDDFNRWYSKKFLTKSEDKNVQTDMKDLNIDNEKTEEEGHDVGDTKSFLNNEDLGQVKQKLKPSDSNKNDKTDYMKTSKGWVKFKEMIISPKSSDRTLISDT